MSYKQVMAKTLPDKWPYKSGLSVDIPASTINEVCGSGLKAILMGMEQIQLGKAQVVLAGGIESMTNAPSLSHYNKAEDTYSVPVSSMTLDGLTDALVVSQWA